LNVSAPEPPLAVVTSVEPLMSKVSPPVPALMVSKAEKVSVALPSL
jgi:hypothetical protein